MFKSIKISQIAIRAYVSAEASDLQETKAGYAAVGQIDIASNDGNPFKINDLIKALNSLVWAVYGC